jgi:hypothetical protein
VRRLFGWTAGLVGIAALARLLARRQARREAVPALRPPSEADPAEALRRKLSDTRATDDTEPSARDAGPADEPTETLDERRARVHAKAQEAIEAMQEPPG